MISRTSICTMLLALATMTAGSASGQSVNVGLGSYSTALPPGAVGPQNAWGQSILPKVSSAFSQPVQTNDFWSSLIYPFYNNPYSNVLYAHPLMVKAVGSGLQIGHTPAPVFAAADYLYPWSLQLTVGIAGPCVPT